MRKWSNTYFSDNVSDTIGDDQVLDQFDIAKPAEFYGTMQDDYIIGYNLRKDVQASRDAGVVKYSTATRRKLFSKLDASTAAALDSTYGSEDAINYPSYAERLVPWTQKVSNHYRIVQCYDEKERFYDSCLPSIAECFEVDGCKVWTTHDDPTYWLSPEGNVKTNGIGFLLFNAEPLTSNKKLSNNSWTWSFPFENKYKNVKRQITTLGVLSNYTTNLTTNWYPKSFVEQRETVLPKTINTFYPLLPGKKQVQISDFSFRLDSSALSNDAGSYRILIPSDVDLNQKNNSNNLLYTGTLEIRSPQKNNPRAGDDMIKFLFGFGDLNNITYTNYTLDADVTDDDITCSYFTGFELENWTYTNPAGGPPVNFTADNFIGKPILPSGSSPNYFNAQFDQSSGDVIVRWIPSSYLGEAFGAQASLEYKTSTGGSYGFTTSYTGYDSYPWLLVKRENSDSGVLTASFDPDPGLEYYNYVSQSVFYSYPDGDSSGDILTGSSAVYWMSGTGPSRNWVLGSYFSASVINLSVGDVTLTNQIYRMPDPILGSKTTSTQYVDITASYPWKISYQRAVSAHTSDYFYSSFVSMPGFPSGIDVVLDKIQGTDSVFAGTGDIETTPQVMSDFTSSLNAPGEYRMAFNYVKTGVKGTSNRIDRAFIDNVCLALYDSTSYFVQDYSAKNRIGYSHYPEFREYKRDTRTSANFPGSGFRPLSRFYNRDRSADATRNDALNYLKANSYGGYEFGISPVIKGWKYGIYNGLPTHSKAIFRRGRYGQFRDMLEQRPFTKYVNVSFSPLENPSNDGIRTTAKSSTEDRVVTKIEDGPVTVEFVRQTARVDANGLGTIVTEPIDPILSFSNNTSSEATSATPFDDRDANTVSYNFNPDGTLNFSNVTSSEMVLVTANHPDYQVRPASAITTLPSINNLVISTRRVT